MAISAGTIEAVLSLRDQFSPALVEAAKRIAESEQGLQVWTEAQQQAAMAMEGTYEQALKLNVAFDSARMDAVHDEALRMNEALSGTHERAARAADTIGRMSTTLARSADTFGLPVGPLRALDDVMDVTELGFGNLSKSAAGFNLASVGVVGAGLAIGTAIGGLLNKFEVVRNAADSLTSAIYRLTQSQSDLDAQYNATQGLDEFSRKMGEKYLEAIRTQIAGLRQHGKTTAEIAAIYKDQLTPAQAEAVGLSEKQVKAYTEATSAAKQHAEAVTALAAGWRGMAEKDAGAVTADALKKIGDASQIAAKQLPAVVDRIDEARAAGITLAPVADEIVERWTRLEDAKKAVEQLNEAIEAHTKLAAEQQAIARELGPTVEDLVDQYLQLSAAMEMRGGDRGLAGLSDQQLRTSADRLNEIAEAAEASGVSLSELEGLSSDLASVLEEMNQRGVELPEWLYASATGSEKLQQKTFDLAGAFGDAGIVVTDDLNRLFKEADYITVHVPKNEQTINMIGDEQIQMMKPTVRLINCARGGIINEDALYKALEEKRIAGAALDVFPKEPPEDNRFAKFENCLVTPHLGASTEEAQVEVAVEAAQILLDAVRGGPIRNALNAPSITAAMPPIVSRYSELARRIGVLLSTIAPGKIKSIGVQYRGTIAEADVQGVTLNFIVGLLQRHFDIPLNMVNAPVLAKERGISIDETKNLESKDVASSFSAKVVTDKMTRIVTGSVFGEKLLRIIEIDGFNVEMTPAGSVLIIFNDDKPGVIGSVGTICGKHQINICTMGVGQKLELQKAILAVSLDKDPWPQTIEELSSLDFVNEIYVCKLD